MRYPANKQTTVHVASLAMVVNKLFVTLVSRLRTQKYKRRHLFCSGSAQRNQRAGSFLWSLYHFLFTSMLVRLHSWVSANQPSPLAHWSKSMSWMLTSTRITPLTQKHTHIHKHTHRRGFTETDVRQCNETRVAPNVTRLIRMITFFFSFCRNLHVWLSFSCLILFNSVDWSTFFIQNVYQTCLQRAGEKVTGAGEI